MELSRWQRWQPTEGTWKTFDVIAYALLILGASGWVLMAVIGFDVAALALSEMGMPLRLFGGLVGLAALYDLLSLPWIFRRWEVHMHRHGPAHA